ncbi:hypothetical protein ScPMuIL_016325 [Solemya velum]
MTTLKLPVPGDRKVSREPTYLSMREATFLSHKSPTLNSAWIPPTSEDGRRRATVLPPLETEPTFWRQPSKIASLQGSQEEAADSHWQKKYKRVSIDVDRRIVNHLRRKLNRRLEKRFNTIDDGFLEESIDQRSDVSAHVYKEKLSQKDLFHSYSETGEKLRVTFDTPFSHKSDNGLISPEVFSHSSESVSNRSSPLPNRSTSLPDIYVHQTKDENTVIVENGHTGRHDSIIESFDPLDIVDLELEKISDAQDEGCYENFRDLAVSPVQTPVVYRPLTRQQTRLSHDDRRTKILKGQVHRLCPPDSKTLSLYVCSEFGDFNAELTSLRENVFPDLRRMCREKGYEFQIYDLHWGLVDGISDDHSTPETCLAQLDKCLESSLGIYVLVLMGQKYGQCILPLRISAEEYDVIYNSAKAYREKQSKFLSAKIASMEQARSERELQRRQSLYSEDGDSVSSGSQNMDASFKGKISTTLADILTGIPEDDIPASVPVLEGIDRDFAMTVSRRRTSMLKRESQIISTLKEKLDTLPDPSLLQEWYKLDENVTPPTYHLVNIRSESSSYDIVRANGKRRDVAKNAWIETSTKLRDIIERFSPTHSQSKSLFEREIEGSVLNAHWDDHYVVVDRTITDLENNTVDAEARMYIDLNPKSTTRDQVAGSRVEHIRNTFRVSRHSQQKNILSYEVEWSEGGIKLSGNRRHELYLERLCKQVREQLGCRLERSFCENSQSEDESIVFKEISRHVMHCHESAKGFQGRKQILQLVKSYIRSPCRLPLVIHGNPGCGKTAMLSKIAKEIHKWFRGYNVSVLFRAVGTTKASTNIRTLLQSLCLQLCEVFGNDPQEFPSDYKGLANDFAQRIAQATVDNPLVVIVDSLDRLTDENEGRNMAWLPAVLPPNVHILVSTRTDDKYDCLKNTRAVLGEESDAFVEIPDLPEKDAIQILEYWFMKQDRTLTEHQYDVLFGAFRKCPVPLFLKNAFHETLQWSSYMVRDMVKIGETVKKIAMIKMGKLEMKYREPFVRRALGYLTASRNGLTGNEIEDVLSLDEAVMDDIMVHYRPSRRHFPTILWIRLRNELANYISECSADNTITFTWSHTQFYEAAEERYLKQRDKAPSYHKMLAEYFLGTWGSKAKPFPGNEKGVLRTVAHQPLFFEPPESNHDGKDRVYNLRKINELPYHLILSQQMNLFKTKALCDFEWVQAKLCGTSLRALLEEYEMGLKTEPSDVELKLLADTLQLSARALMADHRQLAGQIIGRLHNLISKDKPAAPGDPPKYPNIHIFLSQARNSSLPSLTPSVSCLTPPGGILFDLLSGHSEPITALTMTSDGNRALTTAKDGQMKLWDLRRGRVLKTVHNVGTNVHAIQTALNNTYAITVEKNVIRVWDLKTELLKEVIDKHPDPPVICTADEGKILVALYDGMNIMCTWDLVDGFRSICESKIQGDQIFRDNSVLVSKNSNGDQVLHAFRGANLATVQNARTGKVVHRLVCHEKSSSIAALGVTRDYFVVACRQQYMALHEIHQLELFDVVKGKYLRSVRGCMHDNVCDMFINMVGSHAIAVCASEKTNTSNIALWNIETEDHKHLASHAGVSTIGACSDFRYCLTAGKNDSTLRIWNLSTKINQPMPKLKKMLGVDEILPMSNNQRYLLARQVNNGFISVWNIAKAKCLENAVRIERGLSDSSSIVVVRDTKVIILKDRGFSKATSEARPVFQTVLTYDLMSKRYTGKLTGCYITPCPQHEYVLLDDEHLMGLSDNRTHFVIWSLVTGHVVFRIKTKFREEERKHGAKDPERPILVRGSTAKMTPWNLRAESKSARERRRYDCLHEEIQRLDDLKKEKDNSIEQFIISKDQKIIIASFFAHHLCVFDIENQAHVQTLQTEYCMMFLHVSALTCDGRFLVLSNYDEKSKTSYVTLWDCREGQVRKRLKNEAEVMTLGITDDASRVVIGKSNNELRIWDPTQPNSLRRIKGYPGLKIGIKSKIFITDNGKKAVVFAGDISLWDLENGSVLSVFTPDTNINCCNVAMGGQLITFGMHDAQDIVILKLSSRYIPALEYSSGNNLFGEVDSSDDDAAEEED